MSYAPDSTVGISPEQILENAKGLVPLLRQHRQEAEELRHLPEEVVAAADEAGVFRLLAPKSLGGAGGDLADYVALTRTLAQGDLASAWALVFFTAHVWIVGRLGADSHEHLFPNGEMPRVAAVGRPHGEAVRTEGGYLLSGRWKYATGVMNANWVLGPGAVPGESEPGVFDGHMWMIMPRDQVEVIDTWHTSGMRATGSQDVKADGVFVPEELAIKVSDVMSRSNPGSSIHPESAYTYSLSDLMIFVFPALATGAAEALLEGYRERLEVHPAAMSPTISADTEAGQISFAQAASALRLAQSRLDASVAETIAAVEASPEEKGDLLRAQLKLDCLSVVRMSLECAEQVARQSGTSVYRESSPTQQYLRDLQMLRTHVTIDPNGMQHKAGQILLDRATEPNPAKYFV